MWAAQNFGDYGDFGGGGFPGGAGGFPGGFGGGDFGGADFGGAAGEGEDSDDGTACSWFVIAWSWGSHVFLRPHALET